MSLLPLLPLFHSFNREFFDSSLSKDFQPILDLRWSDGRLRKTAGFYRRGSGVKGLHGCEIVLSRPVLANLPQSATESTLCHEMIHAWIDLVLKISEGHGPNFHARMARINTAQSKFTVNVRHQFPVPVTLPRWWAVCSLCGSRFPYRRIVKGAACRQCCNLQYGGMWHPRCLLKYEPALNQDFKSNLFD